MKRHPFSHSPNKVSRNRLILVVIIPIILLTTLKTGAAEVSPCIQLNLESESRQFNFKLDPGLESQVPENATIEQIDIKVFDVFNPADDVESAWYAAAANNLHIKTKPHVVRAQLLFKEGDSWQANLAQESERILRGKKYIYDASVRVTKICGNKITIEVLVRDVWTLLPGIGFSRSGGENEWSVSLTDQNFLGTGTFLTLRRSEDSERATSAIAFSDPNLLNSRWQLRLAFEEKDDGDSINFLLRKPFYSLDSRTSYQLSAEEDERIDSLYFRNQVFQQFNHERQEAELNFGFSQGLVESNVWRWQLGWRMDENEFAVAPGSDLSQPLPENRDRSFFWLGTQYVEDDYLKTTQLNQIGRTEDIFLGKSARLILGYGDPSEVDQKPFWYFSGRIEDSYQPSENSLAFGLLSASGYWDKSADDWENLRFDANGRLLLDPFTDSQWLFQFAATYTDNLTIDRQLLLGGDNGLRGYPARYQLGDRRYLFTVEKRYFLDYEMAGIFRFGFAGFLDIGRAWFPGIDNGINGQTLTDVGFGLRVTSNRFSIGEVLHIDVAFPLNRDDPDIDAVQFLVTGKTSF